MYQVLAEKVNIDSQPIVKTSWAGVTLPTAD